MITCSNWKLKRQKEKKTDVDVPRCIFFPTNNTGVFSRLLLYEKWNVTRSRSYFINELQYGTTVYRTNNDISNSLREIDHHPEGNILTYIYYLIQYTHDFFLMKFRHLYVISFFYRIRKIIRTFVHKSGLYEIIILFFGRGIRHITEFLWKKTHFFLYLSIRRFMNIFQKYTHLELPYKYFLNKKLKCWMINVVSFMQMQCSQCDIHPNNIDHITCDAW